MYVFGLWIYRSSEDYEELDCVNYLHKVEYLLGKVMCENNINGFVYISLNMPKENVYFMHKKFVSVTNSHVKIV